MRALLKTAVNDPSLTPIGTAPAQGASCATTSPDHISVMNEIGQAQLFDIDRDNFSLQISAIELDHVMSQHSLYACWTQFTQSHKHTLDL